MRLSLEQLSFTVDMSGQYHDRRRAHYETWHKVVLAIAILGGSSAIAGVVFLLDQFDGGKWIVVGAGLLIAFSSALDLVVGFAPMAWRHDSLYRRYIEIEAEMAEVEMPDEKHARDWNARVLRICADEPPIFYGVYAAAWNQVIYAHERKQEGLLDVHKHHVKYFLRQYRQWTADDFPHQVKSGHLISGS